MEPWEPAERARYPQELRSLAVAFARTTSGSRYFGMRMKDQKLTASILLLAFAYLAGGAMRIALFNGKPRESQR